jgi:hypothetical protein
MTIPRLRLLAGLILAQAAAAEPKPVEFDFVAPENPSAPNPYTRELWADVVTPGNQTITLPAYYADGGLFAVRARPDEVGVYRFGAVSETTLGVKKADLVVSLVTPAEVRNTERTRLPSIGLDPKDPRMFVRSDGLPYLPVGADLAWAPDGSPDTAAYYQRALPLFAKANLNWMRIWMAHWDGLNLDWLPPGMGASPKPGALSEDVAQTWDRIVAAAEGNGVYIQVVFQHHGQYTTKDNSNWAENPWNAANPGGFLKEPEDFFTDANARVISLMKYRYIVARWGWSPAIVAWELFNEVHWTDAFRKGHEDDVARWHSAAASFIRLVDVYGHLITTSTENLRSPIYEKMDFYQPHLYAANLVAGPRAFAQPYSMINRPVFYGEVGVEHQPVATGVTRRGLNLVPPVWASIMGEGALAAQPWNGWQLLDQNRLNELGGVFRFLAINRIASQTALRPFSAVVECQDRVPLRILAGQVWQRRPAPDFEYPLDGTEPIEAANVPATFDGSVSGRAEGFPGRATYRLDFPRAVSVRVHAVSVAQAGGGLRVSVDGAVVASHAWLATGGALKPDVLEFPVAAGRHALLIEATGPDWVGVSDIDLGLDAPVLAVIGRRNDRFVSAWVWHRMNLFAVNTTAPVVGTVDLDDVAEGTWKVTWWDTRKGVPGDSRILVHPGGTLRLQTPPITRDAAFALTRVQ